MDHQIAVRDKLAERYLLNELNEQARDDFEEHFFSCDICAEDVKLVARFVDVSRTELAEPQIRVLHPAAQEKPSKWFAWLWSPAPAYALALVLGLVAVEQRTAYRPAEGQIEALSPANLRPVTRGTPQVIRVAPGQKVLVVSVSVPAGSTYECTIQDSAGRTISQLTTGPIAGDQLTLSLPASRFGNGSFRLRVRSTSPAFEDEYEWTAQP